MSLRFKLLLPLAFLLAALTLFIYGDWLPRYATHEAGIIQSVEESKVGSLIPAMVTPILTGNLGDLHALLNEQKRLHPEWVNIRVTDGQGRRLYPVTEPPAFGATQVVHIKHAIMLRNQLLGDIELSANIEPLIRQRSKDMHTLGTTLIIMLGLATLIVGAMQENLVNVPIRRLSEAMARINQDRYEAQLPATGGDEIGQLTTQFSEMRQSIKEYQHALESEAQHLRTVLNNVVDGIMTIGGDGNLTSFNPAAEELFGYDEEEVMWQPASMLLPQFDAVRSAYYSDHGPDSGKKHDIARHAYELQGVRKNGDRFSAELAISVMRNDGEDILVGIIRDITQRKQVERMKDEFVSTVSHELRTPLTSIVGSLGLINGGAAGGFSPEARKLIDIASSNCNRLVALINDLLDVSRIESGHIRFDVAPYPLPRLLRNALESNRGYAEQYGVRMINSGAWPEVTINVDENRFMQVMANLLSNAVKFSPAGSTIDVQATHTERNVRISIIDQGNGVPELFRDKIFQKFSQADSSDARRKGGTGLGLSISKSLVEQMGGRMDFCDSPGGGTTFFFDMPVAEAVPLDRPAGARI